jgi:hypothetical protein
MASCNCIICAEEFNLDDQGIKLSKINITSFKICQVCLDKSNPEDDYNSVKSIIDQYLKFAEVKSLFVEAKKIITAKIVSDANKLLLLMKYIKYDNFVNKEDYIVKTPKEVLKNKTVTCYDQVELERLYFEKNNVEFKTFFVYADLPIGENRTHTFLVFKDENNKCYWFENAWNSNKGIHGPYSSYNEVVKYVLDKLKEDWGKIKNIIEYKSPPEHLNSNEFGNYIIENYLPQPPQPL